MRINKGQAFLYALFFVVAILASACGNSDSNAGNAGGDAESDGSSFFCDTDLDCQSPLICHMGSCIDPDTEGTCNLVDNQCVRDSDCEADEFCDNACDCSPLSVSDSDKDQAEDGDSDQVGACAPVGPCIQVQPDALRFGVVQMGDIVTRDLTVINDGNEELSLLVVSFSSDSDSDFSFLDGEITDTIHVAPNGGEVTIGVVLSPQTPNAKLATIEIISNDEYHKKVRVQAYSDYKGATEIKINPETYDFQEVDVNTEQGVELEINCLPFNCEVEESNKVLTIQSIQLEPSQGAFFLQDNLTFPVYIKMNETFSFQVKFNPFEQGINNATLKIQHNADESTYNPVNPIEIPLTGTAVVPCLTLTPEPPNLLDFHDVTKGISKSMEVKMTSSCGGTVIVNKVWWRGEPIPEDFVLDGFGGQNPENLNIRIPPGETVEFYVLYTPSTVGQDAAFLEVHSNDHQKGLQILSVQGEGVLAEVEVTPEMLDFEQTLLFDQKTKSLEVENRGSGVLRLSDMRVLKRLDGDGNEIEGDNPDVFSIAPDSLAYIPMNLDPNDPREFEIIYTPTTEAVNQVDWARLVIYNDSSTPEISVDLRGEPVAPHVEYWVNEIGYEDSLFTESIDYGEVILGTPKVYNLRVKNAGEWPLDVFSLRLQNPSSDFKFTPVDMSGIQPSESRDIPITYLPALPWSGPDDNVFFFESNDFNEDYTKVEIALHGEGIDPKIYIDPSTSQSNPWCFPALYLYDTSIPKEITIYNDGSGSLIIDHWDFYQPGLEGSWRIFDFSQTFPVELKPHSTNPEDELTFKVEFTPNGIVQNQNLILRFYSNSITGNNTYVYLCGEGKPCDSCTYDLLPEGDPNCTEPDGCAGCEYYCAPAPGSECGELSIEKCDGFDNDCNGLVDELWPVGQECDGAGVCGPGVYECATNTTVRCSSEQLPPNGDMATEVCDGLDNDCDGETDEDFEIDDWCAVGVGVCLVGKWECLDPDHLDYPFGRRCNAWDNAMMCHSDGSACASPCEDPNATPCDAVCNGVDDDCDGLTDNGTYINTLDPSLSLCTGCIDKPCDAEGECEWGYYRCGENDGPNGELEGTWIECYSGGVGTPEICDTKDNDCNGTVDDPWQPFVGDGSVDQYGVHSNAQPCDGTGSCGAGFWMCSPYNSLEKICSSANPYHPEFDGAEETCNGQDDDCDGLSDEDFALGQQCFSTGVCSTVPGEWECDYASGERRCSTSPGGNDFGSVPGAVAFEGPPGYEVNSNGYCNNLDDDCDGETDEGYPVGLECEGTGECGNGLTECFDDYDTGCSTDPGGSNYNPRQELCSGKDENCDGLTDNATFPNPAGQLFNVGNACEGEGICVDGQYECANLNSLVCDTLPGGTDYQGETEVCDYLDNNCNGCTDEGFVNYEGNCEPIPCAAGDVYGICAGGHYECLSPDNPAYPDPYKRQCDTMPYGSSDESEPEECNALDDDCDGLTDEDFETCCDPNNCGACGHVCNVPNGTAGCADYECTIESCNAGWYDINEIVDNDGCECYVDNYDQQGVGNSCGNGSIVPAQEYLLDNDAESVSVAGNIVPKGDYDWYTFVGVDGAETNPGGCDEFHVSVRFTNNPYNQYAFQVYKDGCTPSNAVCPEDQRDSFTYYTDDQIATPGVCGQWDPQEADVEYDPNPTCYKGHCPCDPIDNPANEHVGLNYCYLEDVRFYVKVYRREGVVAHCEGYEIEFSNGKYSSD